MNKHIIGRFGVDVNIASTVANNLHLTFLCDSNTWQLTNHSTALGLLTRIRDSQQNSNIFFTIIQILTGAEVNTEKFWPEVM